MCLLKPQQQNQTNRFVDFVSLQRTTFANCSRSAEHVIVDIKVRGGNGAAETVKLNELLCF